MQSQTEFKCDNIRLLPTDMVKIRNRWHELSGRARRDSVHPELSEDRITTRDRIYTSAEDDKIRHNGLQIQYLYAGASCSAQSLYYPIRLARRSKLLIECPSPRKPARRFDGSKKEISRATFGRLGECKSSDERIPGSRETLPKPNTCNPFVGSAS